MLAPLLLDHTIRYSKHHHHHCYCFGLHLVELKLVVIGVHIFLDLLIDVIGAFGFFKLLIQSER